MSDTQDPQTFEGIVITHAYTSAVAAITGALDNIDALDDQAREIVDQAIIGALAIGGYVGAQLYWMGIRPSAQERQQFATTFAAIDESLRAYEQSIADADLSDGSPESSKPDTED